MKSLFYYLGAALIASVYINAQTLTSITPSYYFTYATYPSGNLSRSHSAYITANLEYKWFPTLAYDNLDIRTNDWNYRQQTGIAGVLYSSFPHALKFYYGHLKGDFKYKRNEFFDTGIFDYSDFTNIYAADYSYYYNDWYFGVMGVYLNAIGVLNKEYLPHERTLQAGFRLEYIPAYEWFVSLKPSYFYSETDKRKLYSAALRVHYLAAPRLLLKAGGMVGKRAYYFDTDLLTIANHNETQKQNLQFQCEYFPGEGFTLIASYIHSELQGYQINYYMTGIKKVF